MTKEVPLLSGLAVTTLLFLREVYVCDIKILECTEALTGYEIDLPM